MGATAITGQGVYYANQCIKVSVAGAANTSTVLSTLVYKITFLRADTETFESEEMTLSGDTPVVIDLAAYAKRHIFHQIAEGHNDTAYGWVGISTKQNSYDRVTCDEIEGSWVADISPGGQDYTVLNAYWNSYMADPLIGGAQKDFDTGDAIKTGSHNFLNVFGSARTVTGTSYNKDNTTSAISFTGGGNWAVYKVAPGVNGIPTNSDYLMVNLQDGRKLYYDFCGCSCFDCIDVMFLQPQGAWTVFKFERLVSGSSGQSGQLIDLEGCDTSQYGGKSYLFQNRQSTTRYRLYDPNAKDNLPLLQNFGSASKYMVYDNTSGNWIKMVNAPQDVEIYQEDQVLRLEFNVIFQNDGHRLER